MEFFLSPWIFNARCNLCCAFDLRELHIYKGCWILKWPHYATSTSIPHKREKGAVDLSFDVPRIQMKFHGNLIFFLLVLSIVGDINRIINNPSGGDLISMNSALLMPSADAFTPVRRFGRRIRLPRWPIRRLRPRRV